LRRDTDHSKKNETLYAGRWIARLRGRIVGQGGTPEQAIQAAKAARHKETPLVEFIPMTSPFVITPLMNRI
jgi:hypothetical protein